LTKEPTSTATGGGPIAAASSSGATSTGALAKSTAMNSYEMPDDGITHTTATTTTFQQWADAAGSPPTPPSSPRPDPTAKGPEHLFTVLLAATGITTAD
jgi:hypothetical protein